MVVHVRRAAAIASGLAWLVTVYGLVIRPWHLGALVRRIADLARLAGVVIHARIGMQMRLLCARRSVGSTRGLDAPGALRLSGSDRAAGRYPAIRVPGCLRVSRAVRSAAAAASR